MQRAESCKWNYPKENFADYAMRKQKLIQLLHLSQLDIINLFIGRITNFLIRGVAVFYNITTVDDFLGRMDLLLKAYGAALFKKSILMVVQKQKSKENLSTLLKIPLPKSDKSYCKAKRHEKAEC